MRNKFCLTETADLSKAFRILCVELGMCVDPKIIWDAKKIRDKMKKSKYLNNLVAELDNTVLQLADKLTTLLALLIPIEKEFFQEELRQELMNIIRVRLGTFSCNQKIKYKDILQIFLAQKMSAFISYEKKIKRAKRDRFFPGASLNLRMILNGIELLESETGKDHRQFRDQTLATIQLHTILMASMRSKIIPQLLPVFLECLRINPWLINTKPKTTRGICENIYYIEFSRGNEPKASRIGRIADHCLENLYSSEKNTHFKPDEEVVHADFIKTIGYLANLLILTRLKSGVRKVYLLSGQKCPPGNAFLMEKVLESDRISKLSVGKSRLAMKTLRPWPIVHHVKLDGQKYNWYEGLWKACQSRKFTPLKWKENDLQTVERHLAEVGQTGLGRFITLHIRDANFYHGESHEKKFHGDRNARISEYRQMVKEVLQKGYSVVLVGSQKANPLNIKDPKIYDYAHSDFKAPILDIYFMSRCALFVGTNSGPFAVPGLYGTPALITNFTPIGNSLGFPQYFYLPKKIWNKKNRTFMSFLQQLEAPQAYAQQIVSVDKNYTYLENTSAELRAAGLWIDEFLSGRYRPSASWREYFNDPIIKKFPRQISIPEFYFQMNQSYFKG